mgnify:CR=1 FL=1
MTDAYIIDGTRTPFGRFAGALSGVRTDDLAAHPIRALMARFPNLPWEQVDDVIYGDANQAGEDNRNIARMAGLLAGLPVDVPGMTVNRLCGSGLEAVAYAARTLKAGEGDFFVVGGVESMSRAPFVMPKATTPFSRNAEIYDTTIGWRFVNPRMKQLYGTDSMPETGENVAEDYGISREDQDAMAMRSQQRAATAQAAARQQAERKAQEKADFEAALAARHRAEGVPMQTPRSHAKSMISRTAQAATKASDEEESSSGVARASTPRAATSGEAGGGGL